MRLDIGRRYDGKFNIWRHLHTGWIIIAVFATEAEALAFIGRP